VVCRRYWGFNLRAVKKLGTGTGGGQYVDGIHFSFAAARFGRLLSLCSYFGKGENRERYLGVKIPPTNLQPDYLEQARAFADNVGRRSRRRCSERSGALNGSAEPQPQPERSSRA